MSDVVIQLRIELCHGSPFVRFSQRCMACQRILTSREVSIENVDLENLAAIDRGGEEDAEACNFHMSAQHHGRIPYLQVLIDDQESLSTVRSALEKAKKK